MEIELDLDRLLFDNRGNNMQDSVWRLQPSAGKQVLLLPFNVDNVNRANKLTRFPLSVRAGRFIGFVIPKPDNTRHGGDQVDLGAVIRAAPGELRQLLFEDGTNSGEALEPGEVNSPDEDAEKPTPDSAPRLAREITLHPDGTVQWAMARSIHTGELQNASEQNPYVYKIDPEQLRAIQPERAERLTRNDGEDARAYAERKRAHQIAEREKQNAYRELRDMLRKLPETFREPTPSVLYAAIEVPAGDALSLEGPAPYPWSVDAEKRQLIEQLSRNANAFEGAEGEQLAGSIVTMIKEHPLDARAIALAVNRGRQVGQVSVDDPGYQVLSRLLQSNDIPTRRIALYSVATTNPPTLASAKLIGVASEAALGEERKMLSFASLGKLFSTDASDSESAKVLIDRVSQTIADPQGPSAPKVIEQVLASLGSGQRHHSRQATDDATAAMIEAIDLSGVTPDEYDGVARAIVQAAPENPVAAGWLDHKLLGSSEHELVNRTLSFLYESVIAPPKEDRGYDAEGIPAPAVEVEPGKLELVGTIPVTRAGHALFKLFESNDDVQQAAAWAVLGKFHLALPEPAVGATPETPVDPQAAQEPEVDLSVALFDSILKEAGEREKMPMSVVAFIINQKDPALTAVANDRFVALLARDDLVQKTARAATEVFIATPDRFTQAMSQMPPEDQFEVMQTMYESQEQEAPLVAGLIADRGTVMSWLTGYLKENGQLPNPDAWNEMVQTQSENTFLQSAASDDATLASAGASALVISAGGDLKQQQAFATKVALMESREHNLVKTEWDKQRVKIFASAYQAAAGTYRLVVTLAETGEQPDAPEENKPAKRIDLGLVELQVDGVELSLSAESVKISSMTDKLGIKLDNPVSLRSFSKPELTAIAPANLSTPIEILPKEGGVWAGDTPLRDGRLFGVLLEPAD